MEIKIDDGSDSKQFLTNRISQQPFQKHANCNPVKSNHNLTISCQTRKTTTSHPHINTFTKTIPPVTQHPSQKIPSQLPTITSASPNIPPYTSSTTHSHHLQQSSSPQPHSSTRLPPQCIPKLLPPPTHFPHAYHPESPHSSMLLR